MPAFWNAFAEKMKEGNVILLDMVKSEIDKGQDELQKWVKEKQDDFVGCNHIDPEIIPKYADVMQYIQGCGLYNQKGLDSWAKNDIADPWLVATAMAKGYTLITFEQSAGALSPKNKSGKVKIPDVASHFGVRVHNLYYMMRQLGIRI